MVYARVPDSSDTEWRNFVRARTGTTPGRNEARYKAAVAVLRTDTLARFAEFELRIPSGSVVVTREHLLRTAVSVAREFGIARSRLTHAWQRYCTNHYGEIRRWPGPRVNPFGDRQITVEAAGDLVRSRRARTAARERAAVVGATMDDGDSPPISD